MTFEKLLECSAAQLESMSDKELAEHLEPYLKFTKPEFIEKPTQSTKRSVSSGDYVSQEKQAKKAKAQDILQQLGIDLKL